MSTVIPFKTPKEIAAKFGCTEEQARAQLTKNRAEMLGMLEKARRTGKPVNNYTEAQLEEVVLRMNKALREVPVLDTKKVLEGVARVLDMEQDAFDLSGANFEEKWGFSPAAIGPRRIEMRQQIDDLIEQLP